MSGRLIDVLTDEEKDAQGRLSKLLREEAEVRNRMNALEAKQADMVAAAVEERLVNEKAEIARLKVVKDEMIKAINDLIERRRSLQPDVDSMIATINTLTEASGLMRERQGGGDQ